jgi:hypothetical protein
MVTPLTPAAEIVVPMRIDGERSGSRWRIVIRGRLSDRLGSAFPEMALERRAGQTVLRGVADEAQLRELLERVGDLGLEAVRVDVDD